jgi:cobalt/nickel transport system permease protein
MAVLTFIIVSASTPITTWQAFIAYFAAIFAVSLIAKIPTLTLLTRSLIEIPFIFFAILMPFFGSGERFEAGPFNLYRESLLAAAGIVVKGTLGVLSAVVLSTTTTARELLRGACLRNAATLTDNTT